MLKTLYLARTRAVPSDTSPRAAPKFERHANEMRTLAGRMAALPAPGPLADRRDRVAEFMTAVSKDLATLSRDAAQDNQSAAGTAIQNVNGHTEGLTKAQGELQAAIADSSGSG